MIEGVKIVKLNKFVDERGVIMHGMRNDEPEFERFGEIYFSLTFPNAIKAWHCHLSNTLNYFVPVGQIKLVLYDWRDESPTRGELQEIFIGEHNYCRVTIPAGVWNGHKAIGDKAALVANCATRPHDPEEMLRDDPYDPDIRGLDYDWGIKNK